MRLRRGAAARRGGAAQCRERRRRAPRRAKRHMRRGGVTTSFESKPMASYSMTDRSRDGESRPRREVSRAGRAASAVAFVSRTRASSCRRPKSMATLAACAGESVLLRPSSGCVRRRAVASRAVERCGSREGPDVVEGRSRPNDRPRTAPRRLACTVTMTHCENTMMVVGGSEWRASYILVVRTPDPYVSCHLLCTSDWRDSYFLVSKGPDHCAPRYL